MKRVFTIILTLSLLVSLPISGVQAQSEQTAPANIQEMITLALQDELNAKATYEKILETYPNAVPFNGLASAESMHIKRLTLLAGTYKVPAELTGVPAEIPAKLEETLALGLKTEQNNIAMYEKFLAEELPQDVRFVFQRLMMASRMHFRALSANADKTIPGNISPEELPGQNNRQEKPFGKDWDNRNARRNDRRIQRNENRGCGQNGCPNCTIGMTPRNNQFRHNNQNNNCCCHR